MSDSPPRKRRRKVNPDHLHARALSFLSGMLDVAEEAGPGAVLANKASADIVLKISDHLRQLNKDLNSTLDVRALQKMSDAEFEELERMAKK